MHGSSGFQVKTAPDTGALGRPTADQKPAVALGRRPWGSIWQIFGDGVLDDQRLR
jgi:hypothetical protein